jgi:hypothetical protein
MDVHARIARRTRRVAMLVAAATAALGVATLPPSAVGAATSPVDPTALPRGADPSVVHLVRDTIKDGERRVAATRRGEHQALWVVAGGYLVRDYDVGPRQLTRVVFVSHAGEQRVVARSRSWIQVEVSTDGRRIATQVWPDDTGVRSVLTVFHPRTGAVLGQRTLRLATLAALTRTRVLVGRRARWKDPATVWWNYQRDSLRRIHGQAAINADVAHDTVVFERSSIGEFCNRVAVLSRPGRTLWTSCRVYPHQWSPDGSHAIATHTYFDAAGTDRWWVVDGRTAQKQARITGRLDWDAVWEDDQHFLTKAQSERGKAAVVRCDLAGTCERASRVWDVPLPEDSVYYAPPPVVLADR